MVWCSGYWDGWSICSLWSMHISYSRSRADIAYMARMLHWDVGWLYESSYTHPTALSPLNKCSSANKYNTLYKISGKNPINLNVAHGISDFKRTRVATRCLIHWCCHWCMSACHSEQRTVKVITCGIFIGIHINFFTFHPHLQDTIGTYPIGFSFPVLYAFAAATFCFVTNGWRA